MFLRDAPAETLTQVMDKLDEHAEAIPTTGIDLEVDYRTDQIKVGDRQVPITKDGIKVLGDWTGVPEAFLFRLDADLRQIVLNELLKRRPEDVVVRLNDTTGVRSVRKPTEKFFEPRRIVEVASRVLTPEAPVVEWRNDDGHFRLDTVVVDGATYGIGGDRAVGDLTKGGLRFGMDTGKQNLVPYVQEYHYRLVCTNGAEVFNPGRKVSGRGESVEEVLAELELQAQLAFGAVEKGIAEFYDLRNEQVENPERTMLRLAAEGRLPDRLTLDLVDAVPSLIGEDDHSVSMFDLVNLVTNAANDPANRSSARTLQRFGGAIISSHAARCGRCQAKLN